MYIDKNSCFPNRNQACVIPLTLIKVVDDYGMMMQSTGQNSSNRMYFTLLYHSYKLLNVTFCQIPKGLNWLFLCCYSNSFPMKGVLVNTWKGFFKYKHILGV